MKIYENMKICFGEIMKNMSWHRQCVLGVIWDMGINFVKNGLWDFLVFELLFSKMSKQTYGELKTLI